MYNKRESSQIRQEFWTVFGKYMSPVPSSEGEKINWINYHTGVKDIFFRKEALNNSAFIAITMESVDPLKREKYFNQLEQFKTIFHATMNEEWTWERNATVDNKEISRVYIELPGVSIFNKDQWPNLISFFKPRMIAMDEFWETAKWSMMEI
jgi:hypothetical protein